MMSTGLPRDQVGGRTRSRSATVAFDRPASVPPQIGEPVNGEHAEAAAVGDDRQALAGEGLLPTERLGSGKQFVEVENTQQTGAPESRIVDRVGSGKGAGMRGRRARSLFMAARFDDDDRLDAGGGPRGRHEFLRSADQLDIEQNGAGRPVGGEIIEAVAKIDVQLIADRNDRREARCMANAPFGHRRGNST